MPTQRQTHQVTSPRLVIDLPEAFMNKRVEVTVRSLAEGDATTEPNGNQVADLLEKMAQTNTAASFADPMHWQRETRRDRPGAWAG